MIRLLSVAALALLLPVTAAAGTLLGPQVGFSSDPDQFVVGGHFSITEVAPNLSFDPGLDIGIGDNFTSFAINVDMHYHFDISGSSWRPYVGGGATLFFADEDSFAGGAILAGAGVPTKTGSRFFAEFKVGMGDVPDFKLMAGWSFPR